MKHPARDHRALCAAGALLVIAGCASLNESATIRLEGSATYRERMMLPPGAVLTVTVEDVSRAGGAAEVLGSTEVRGHRSPPIPFVVEYPAAKIVDGQREAHMILQVPPDGPKRVAGFSGCNHMTGGSRSKATS